MASTQHLELFLPESILDFKLFIQSTAMNTLIKYCLAGTLLLSVLSCEKSLELDIENPNRIDESNFWKTSADAVEGINAVYGNFYRNGAPYSRWLPFYMDVRSDDGYS